jgi:hypothetical protein
MGDPTNGVTNTSTNGVTTGPSTPPPGDFPDYTVGGPTTTGGSNFNLYLETVDPNNKIQTLLGNEMNRLTAKQKVIDPIHYTKLRQNAQKRSMTLRKNAFSYIFLVVVILMGVIVTLLILKNYFPVIPDILVDCVITFVVGGGIIYVATLFTNISNRDLLDFEKIDYGVLIDISNSSPLDISLNAIYNRSSEAEDCVGEACCPTGTYFYGNTCHVCPKGMALNRTTGKCVLIESFSSFSPNPSFTPL